jgi:hypothetical protein
MSLKKYIIFMLAMTAACRPASQQYKLSPFAETKLAPEQTAFYAFKIVANIPGPSAITLDSRSMTPGKLKPQADPTPFPSRLAITQIDDASKILDKVSIEHPLFRMVEFISEQNILNRKPSTAKQAEFFVRLPWRPTSSLLQIEEFKDNQLLGKTIIELK